jgi:peroxiredoxin/SAM-dependent methyltransferase
MERFDGRRRRLSQWTTAFLGLCLTLAQCHRGRQVPPGTDSVEARRQIDLRAYDGFIRSRLSEVFPLLAAQVVSDYEITRGRALDISYGPPYLAMELAHQTTLVFDVLAADSTEAALCVERIEEAGLSQRFNVHVGRADFLPFRDGAYDLVLTRDAMRFWKDKAAVYREINRVLKRGGIAFLGAGLGRNLPESQAELLWASVQYWRNKAGPQPWSATLPYPEYLGRAAVDGGIQGYELWTEGYCTCRTWVVWRKGASSGAEAGGEVVEGGSDKPSTGVPAPDFSLKDTDGAVVRLADLRGQVVLLDFWAVNCRSCLNMMKRLEPVRQRLGQRGCRFLAINMDWRKDKLDRFLERHDLPYVVLYDDAGVSKAYGVMGIPHFALVDRNGLLRHQILGGSEATATRIEEELLRLLGERERS